MDWTQALSQFAGGFANADLRRRQLAEQKRQREAVAKAQGARWEMDYKLKLEELAAKAKADARSAGATIDAARVTDFGTRLESLANQMKTAEAEVRSTTDPVRALERYNANVKTFGDALAGFKYQWDTNPAIKTFYDPTGRLSFEQFIASRTRSPYVSQTASPNIDVDMSAIAKEVRDIVEKSREDVASANDPVGLSARLEPFRQRLRAAGYTTKEDIERAVPELAYGTFVDTEQTSMQPRQGAEWSPLGNLPFPGPTRPSFLRPVDEGGFRYKVGLPESIDSGWQNFPEDVGNVFSGQDLIRTPTIKAATIPGTGVQIPSLKQPAPLGPTMKRAASLLTDPGFMNQLGIKDANEYRDPAVRERAVAYLFRMPGFAGSRAGKELATMLESGPISRIPLEKVTKTTKTMAMPAPLKRTVDDAAMRDEKLRGEKLNNAINDLKLKVDTKTADYKVEQERLKALLPKLEYELKVDQNNFNKWAKETSLGLQGSRLDLERVKEINDFNQMRTVAVPRLLNSVVNTSVQALATTGKALGNAINVALAGGLLSKTGLRQSEIDNLQNKFSRGEVMTEEEQKQFKKLNDAMDAIPGTNDYFKARKDYEAAYNTYTKWLGVQQNWMDYAQTASTYQEFGQIGIAPGDATLPGFVEDEEPSVFEDIFGDESGSVAPAAEPSAVRRPQPVSVRRGSVTSPVVSPMLSANTPSIADAGKGKGKGSPPKPAAQKPNASKSVDSRKALIELFNNL